jgi:AcrR family transcriptional regulator
VPSLSPGALDRQTTAGYQSPLREAQSAATSQRILEAVGIVLERGEEPTYALVAEAAGCQERTVYRHFPTREHLAAADTGGKAEDLVEGDRHEVRL